MKLLPSSLIVLVAVLPVAALAADADAGVHTKGPTAIHISHGQKVNLSDYMVPGKTMIFDFYSEFCPPCRALAPYLEKLHEARPDIDVVKIDINRPNQNSGIDWKSPVARQYDLQLIPHLLIIGPDGKKIAEDGADPDSMPANAKVMEWVQALR